MARRSDRSAPASRARRPAAGKEVLGEAEVMAAGDLVTRVLVNLVDNAFRHTPATAGVEVGAHRERQ